METVSLTQPRVSPVPSMQSSSSAHLSSVSFRKPDIKLGLLYIIPPQFPLSLTHTLTLTLICLSLFPSFFWKVFLFISFSLWFDMDSQNLKQRRVADDPTTTPNQDTGKREMRMKMAKRGLRSLALAVSLPVALHLITIYFASTNSYRMPSKPFWFPPMWALRLTCLASSFLMGLAAWLVWVEGGFHKHPMALPVYLSQLVLSLAWDPLVFGAGAPMVGLVVCVGMLGALVGCCKVSKDVNATAADLVKPCLAWVCFLAVVNLKLVFH